MNFIKNIWNAAFNASTDPVVRKKNNRTAIRFIIGLFCFVCFLGFLSNLGKTPCERCFEKCRNDNAKSVIWMCIQMCHSQLGCKL